MTDGFRSRRALVAAALERLRASLTPEDRDEEERWVDVRAAERLLDEAARTHPPQNRVKVHSREAKPTPSQHRVLANLIAGRPGDAHVSGMAQAGGYTVTMASLVRRGWVDAKGEVTLSGKKAWAERWA